VSPHKEERIAMPRGRFPILLMVGLILWLFDLPSAIAQDLYIYPNQGQSQEQQNADQGECHVWAVQQSGFDPANPPPPPPGVPAPQGSVAGGAVKGGAVGPAGGALIGAITGGKAGKGAAIGSIGGGLFGGIRSHSQQSAHADQQAAAQQQYQAQIA
jgi:hypothetical protein